MTIIDIILKKRNGKALSRTEIEYFINSYLAENIPDYQVSALLMAIYFSGMTMQETTDLAQVMAVSGDQIDLSAIQGITVDKHSTGGVADTTTLVSAPIVAACGGKVAKMSGRGLGHTGGTVDKLESIPGLSMNQEIHRFYDIVSQNGLSIIGQTSSLVPADKKLYALRDVTGTIDNVALIASSIMSKKIASGTDAIVLDIKTGTGAFMNDIVEAEALAKIMVDIGKLAGKKTIALVTDMNQPLGCAIGNALEVKEAIQILQGKNQGDLRDVSVALAVQMLLASEVYHSIDDAKKQVEEAIISGSALARLEAMISAQGGDSEVVRNTDILPVADRIIEIKSPVEGYLEKIETNEIGMAALLLGAGRLKKEDDIDPAVGIWMKARLGDFIQKDQILAEFHINDEKNFNEAEDRFLRSIKFSKNQPRKNPLIYSHLK